MANVDHVVAENQGAHQFRMMGSDPHGQHATERVSEKHRGSRNALAQKTCDVFGILRPMVSASDARRLAMAAQVGREDMPAQAQRRNHRQKYLPAAAEPVQQYQRRSVGRAFGIVHLNAYLNAQLKVRLNARLYATTNARLSFNRVENV